MQKIFLRNIDAIHKFEKVELRIQVRSFNAEKRKKY